jgi:hypothetical protein
MLRREQLDDSELGLYLEMWRLELGSVLSRRTLLIQSHLQELWSSVELPAGERCAGELLGVSWWRAHIILLCSKVMEFLGELHGLSS